jgi:hypothetical protein
MERTLLGGLILPLPRPEIMFPLEIRLKFQYRLARPNSFHAVDPKCHVVLGLSQEPIEVRVVPLVAFVNRRTWSLESRDDEQKYLLLAARFSVLGTRGSSTNESAEGMECLVLEGNL